MIVALALLLAASPDAGTPVIFGGDRPVTLSVPRSYAGRPTPLVLVLHGYGSSGKHHEHYLGLDTLVDAKGVLLVSPDGTVDPRGNRFWNAGTDACCNFGGSAVDDVKYLRELIAAIRGAYNVDPKRIYVVGHSNGGFLAHRLGCALSKDLAAIVSLAGAMPVERCEAPMNALQIHGDRDVLVRLEGGTRILRRGGPYPGAVESLARWARADRCKPTRTSGPPIDLEPTIPGAETTVSSWDCPPGTAVTLWTIEGGSHVPTFDARFPALVWGWLEAHPRR